MASSSLATSSTGPLPSKRGEIGYQEEVHGQQQVATADGPVLPERHPADRDHPPSTNSPTPPSESTDDVSSTRSTGKHSIASFLSNKNLPAFGGISLLNIILLVLQCLIFGGTVAGWVIASKSMTSSDSNNSNDNQSGGGTMTSSGEVFVHVAFAVVSLAQLLLLERRIRVFRIQRYMYLHPGEILPTSISSGRSALPLAPWQRPPIPTYAATLTADGVGTGDVEDSEIARTRTPPPVYGKTRGSMLLLGGYMRESLRAQVREYEVDRRSMSERSDRPVSFVSRDEDWEERRDAERARRLEEALARLESSENGDGHGTDSVSDRP